jgi:O-antigen ligase
VGAALTALTPVALVVGRAAADVVVSAVAVLFLFDSLRQRRFEWAKQGWVAAALALWAYTVVRAAFVPFENGGIVVALGWVRYILFAASLAKWALATERGRTWLLVSASAAVAFLSVDALIQYVLGQDLLGRPLQGDRLTGIYKKPVLGMTIALLFAAPVFWLLQRKEVWKALLLADVCLVTVFLSGDRMGLILAAFVMMVWLFWLVKADARRWKYLLMSVAVFVGLVAAAPHLTQRQVKAPSERQIGGTLATIKEMDNSPYALVWKSALNVGAHNPLFGVGIKQFRMACPDGRFGPEADAKTGYSRCYLHPHNAYMEWFAEGGAFGLVGFVGFVAVIAVSLWRRLWAPGADLILWGLAAVVGMRLMPLFVSTSFFHNWAAIPFWLALGWAMSYQPRPQSKRAS